MKNQQNICRAFGQALRSLRRRTGYTQLKLASEGVAQPYLSNMERGRHDPSLSMIQHLSELMGIPVTRLMGEYERNYARLMGHADPAGLHFDMELRGDMLIAITTGSIERQHQGLVQLWKRILDGATEKGATKILVNALAWTGELSSRERMDLYEEMSDYYQTRRMNFRIALVGKPPSVNGFAIQAARNDTTMQIRKFQDERAAVNWLAKSHAA